MDVILEIDILGNYDSNPIDKLRIEYITKKTTFKLDYHDSRAWGNTSIDNILYKMMTNYVKRQQFDQAFELRNIQRICFN